MISLNAIKSGYSHNLSREEEPTNSGVGLQKLRILSVVSNIFLTYMEASENATGVINFPFRSVMCLSAWKSGSPWRLAFEVSTLCASFFPYGREATIALDMLVLTVRSGLSAKAAKERVASFFSSCTASFNFGDRMTRKTALEILGITEDQAQDPEAVEREYQEISQLLKRKIEVLMQLSPPLAQRLQSLLDKVEMAYQHFKSTELSTNFAS